MSGLFGFLKDHPFAVDAFFKESLVLTFAVPKNDLEAVVPPCFKLDVFNDEFAFIAVAMVSTTGLRPKGFPKLLGNDFFLIGYRIFVRYTTNSGKTLRGLYILKSETDKRMMQLLGNLFTHYRYTNTDVSRAVSSNKVIIKSVRSNLYVQIERPEDIASLPEHSPFETWKEARRFAGPLPFTFSFDPLTKTVLIVQGIRENWTPMPVKVEAYHFAFVEELNVTAVNLASAFIVNNISYSWKAGIKEKWNG